MRLHDPAADGQAHAGPLGSPAAALEPVELVEHPLPLRARDAGAVVDHPQLDGVAGLAGGHLDGAGGGVAAGVVEQVGQHLVEADRVDQHRGQLLGHVHVDPLPGGGPGPAHHRAHHLGDRALDQPRVQRPGLDAGHVEQVVDQPGEPVGLGVDGGQELVPLGVAPADLPVEQARGRRLDRGQRGAQVVGDRVEQGGAQPVGLLQGHRPVALLLLLALLDGQRGLVGEGGQDPALGLAEPRRAGAAGHHHQRPDHVLAAAHGHRQGPARLQVGPGRAADLDRGLAGGGREALVEVVRHLAVDRGQAEALARGQHDGAPGQVEQRAHGDDHPVAGCPPGCRGRPGWSTGRTACGSRARGARPGPAGARWRPPAG